MWQNSVVHFRCGFDIPQDMPMLNTVGMNIILSIWKFVIRIMDLFGFVGLGLHDFIRRSICSKHLHFRQWFQILI